MNPTLFAFCLLALISSLACQSPEQTTDNSLSISEKDGWAPEIDSFTFKYGFVTDSLEEITDAVKRNEHLSSILLKYDVDYATIHEMVQQSAEVFDVRKIRKGQEYKIYCSKDTGRDVRCFVYEKNPLEYVVFDLRDSITVYEGIKEVVIETDSASGIINSSLYETMVDIGVSPVLAMELSDVYAWQVDFFRIDKGDRFKVIYEKQFVENKAIGIGNILAASFTHKNKEFYAIRFMQDSIPDYFDETGQSLRKAFLKAPLKFSRISSHFSRRRFHPVLKRYKAHLGTDYAAPRGTPILAIGDGTVIESGYKSGNGNYVKIKHNGTYTTGYLHMSKRGKGISKGVFVQQGDVIGYVGSTGLATGPHLCFRFFKNGEQINALTVEVPPSEPVKPEHEAEYTKVKNNLLQALQTIPFSDPDPAVSAR